MILKLNNLGSPKRGSSEKLEIDEKEFLFVHFVELFRYPITAAPLVFTYYTEITFATHCSQLYIEG